MLIHILHQGYALCGAGAPNSWPLDFWISRADYQTAEIRLLRADRDNYCPRCEAVEKPTTEMSEAVRKQPAPKMIICVRKDLNMRKGKIAAQVAHASMSFLVKGNLAGAVLHKELSDVESAWLSGSFTKIVAYVNSEAELLALIQAGEAAGIEVHAIHDNGLTEFHGVKTLTCAAFGPDLPEILDPITGHLPLL